MKNQHADLTAYIYEACRCAVAHASEKVTTYNPESIEDEIRFYQVLPVVHALAKLIIENEFGIKSTFTILNEHLYELSGFHELLGYEISQRLKAGESLATSEIKFNKKISLRIWGKPKLKPFENLTVEVQSASGGVLTLLLTRDKIIKFNLMLDFPKEKLIFDPMQPISFNDNGSKSAALQMSYAYKFYSEFMGNPVLEIWETKSNMILGRTLEYLPAVRPGQPMPHTLKEKCLREMREWKQKAKDRVGKSVRLA